MHTWFHTRWLEAAHFSRQGERWWLNKDGRKRFFAAFEKRVVPIQRALRRQARTLIASLPSEGL